MTKRRTRAAKATTLTPYMRLYLTAGDYSGHDFPPGTPGHVEAFMLRKDTPENREELRRIWLLHRDEILRQWKAEKRRGKPWAEKAFGGPAK